MTSSAAWTPWYCASSNSEMPLMSEWAKRTGPCGAAAVRRASPQTKPGYRTDHRVAPEHDVGVRHRRLDSGVGPPEVGEDQRDPVAPVLLQHPGAGHLRVRDGKREIVGQHAAAGRHPQVLVGRHHVTERRAVVEHVVPRGPFRQAIDGQIRHQPRAVGERFDTGRRIAVDDARRGEPRQGIDAAPCPVPDGGLGAGVQHIDIDATGQRDAVPGIHLELPKRTAAPTGRTR